MKIILADDATLIREGLAGLLERLGHQVIAQAEDVPGLIAAVTQAGQAGQLPDVLVTDVRMPPGMSDDGLRAAVKIREDYPDLGIMVLSQYVAPAYAAQLFSADQLPPPGQHAAGTGYLLKERVSRVADFLNALKTVADGGVVVDPEVAVKLVRERGSALASLTARESEVLGLMAQGLSNEEIAKKLFLSGASVAKHIANVFMKLGLTPDEPNRRVRAVLAYLTATGLQS
ncbi:response regulator transcription factor [Varibaculum cambriense]|uniref:response regulator transcription factor n=1 Tax=Varibaculum cambriense TaxID=184870 RepID=UPI0028FE6F4D|nr:response regulator transcription factor [Varibaculum cambriense]MDU1224539.1 response regulator transcription factor [Varibaculum cambriense]